MSILITLLAPFMWASYLAPPIYAIYWLRTRPSKGSPLWPGIVVITLWFTSTAAMVAYFLSGWWYSEHSNGGPASEVVAIFVVLVAFPLALIAWLIKRRRQEMRP